MDQATLFRGKPGKIMLAGAAFLLLVTIPYLFAHYRQGQRTTTRGESTVRVERKGFAQILRLGSVVNFAVFVRNGRQSGICLQNICSSRSIFTNVASALQGF